MVIGSTQGKDAKALSYAASFYLSGNVDYVKAEDYYKKAIAIEPQNLKYKADLIQLYEKKNDQAAITKTISEMKTVNNQLTNRDLGVYFAQYGNVALADKYLLKAVNEDKNNDAILNLGIFYYNIGKKDEAKKFIAQAQSLGVKGADETMQQIKTAEANIPTK
jgi:tetratricopeptide (TPR) repeat protein